MTIVHTAHLRVRPDAVEAFRTRLRRHSAISVAREPGCLRFDIFEDQSDETLFFLHEIYEDESALEWHRNSEHYLSFRADVADWVVSRSWWYWTALSVTTE